MRLKSKKAIITGGASGIGRAICEVFSKEGAKIVIADINETGGAETASIIKKQGGNSLFIKADISSESSIENLIQKSIDFLGEIDILVNDAAAFIFGKVEQITSDDWKKVFNINVIGAANMVKHTLPYLKKSSEPSITNIASISSFIAQPAFVPYNASKGALLQLTRCLAMDLAEYNIRVNCICPGTIETPALERVIEFEGSDRKKFLQAGAETALLKRLGTPKEVAYAVLFLASSEASFITGTHLIVDGGATI